MAVGGRDGGGDVFDGGWGDDDGWALFEDGDHPVDEDAKEALEGELERGDLGRVRGAGGESWAEGVELAVHGALVLEGLDVAAVATACTDALVDGHCDVVAGVGRAVEAFGAEDAGAVEAAVPAPVHALAGLEDVPTDLAPPALAVLAPAAAPAPAPAGGPAGVGARLSLDEGPVVSDGLVLALALVGEEEGAVRRVGREDERVQRVLEQRPRRGRRDREVGRQCERVDHARQVRRQSPRQERARRERRRRRQPVSSSPSPPKHRGNCRHVVRERIVKARARVGEREKERMTRGGTNRKSSQRHSNGSRDAPLSPSISFTRCALLPRPPPPPLPRRPRPKKMCLPCELRAAPQLGWWPPRLRPP